MTGEQFTHDLTQQQGYSNTASTRVPVTSKYLIKENLVVTET